MTTPNTGLPNDVEELKRLVRKHQEDLVNHKYYTDLVLHPDEVDFAIPKPAEIHALKASITIDSDKQEIIVEAVFPDGSTKTFHSKGYTWHSLLIPSVTKEPGILYVNPELTEASAKLFLAQYPTFFGERGRIVLDMWNNSEIIGTFKSSGSHFGALASGTWTTQ